MRKVGRSFRKDSDQQERAEKEKVRSELLAKLRELVRVGGHEAEPAYVQVVKQIYRDQFAEEIGKEELKERIRQYHDAVSERQSRDQGFF